jgi:hypothetical protein
VAVAEAAMALGKILPRPATIAVGSAAAAAVLAVAVVLRGSLGWAAEQASLC